MTNSITPRQKQALKFIIAFSERYPYPPTNTEIAEGIDSSTESVRQMLLKLQEQGYITREPHLARSIFITEKVEELFGVDPEVAAIRAADPHRKDPN